MIRITNDDLEVVNQRIIEPRIQIDVYDEDNKLLDSIQGGIISGSSSINSESDIRRTFNIDVIPNKQFRVEVSKDGLIWINRTIKLQIGIYNRRTRKYNWYKQGSYVFMNTSATYDATNNQLTLNCSDFMAKLDGTKNGQLGALTTIYPAYEEDEETGEPIKYNIIRDAVITTITQLGHITDYNVDDIGEYKAMPQYNPDYEKYREENPLWNTIPYDLEFSCGCSILSILTEFRDLYPNYEMFFDENGTFVCQMIPSNYYDDISIPDEFLRKILISENTTIDLSTIRNICEVWGQVIDTEFYTEDCTLSGTSYVCNVEAYEEKYYNGDLVAVKVPVTNPEHCTLNINDFGDIGIYDENTDEEITKEQLEANTVYVFKIKIKRENGQDITKAYLLGHWQAHGMNVLVDGSTSTEDYITSDGRTVKKYSLEYFQDVYGCESVQFTIIPNSPFTVQKLGEILDVKTGGEYENITSDSLALARAEWENWKNCRLTDAITITTKFCPFADVNIKVSYRRSDLDQEYQYIVKSVSHDFSSFTTTWNLYRFYPLYMDTLKEMGTYKVLSNYSYGVLSKYTHEQLMEFIDGGEY